MKFNEDIVVSISCLTYNHAPYLRDCLEGFLMQKTDFEFEIIIHDDASTDGTVEIIKNYEAKYPGIIKPIYQQTNQYSKGIKVMWEFVAPRWSGEYIALCEGDDFWTDPLKLQKQVDFLKKKYEFSAVCHNSSVVYEGRYMRSHLFNKFSQSTEITVDQIIENWTVPTSSILFRRKCIENYPSWHTHIYSGDFTLILILLNKGKIRYFNDVMSVYRINYSGTSASSRYKNRHIFIWEEHIKLLDYYNNYTNRLYHSPLKRRIKYLKNEISFARTYEKYSFLVILFMPRLFCLKIFRQFTKPFNKIFL